MRRDIQLIELFLGRYKDAGEIDAARSDFPELGKIDSTWLAHTPVWESEKTVWFFHVWPNGVRERFAVGY